MSDPSKLRAFQLADELTLAIYRATKTFPGEEEFGLTAQMRRAAISVACNIVEGCARYTEADYLHFLDMAYSSSRELGHQLSLASRLDYVTGAAFEKLRFSCEETSKVLNGLIRSLRR